jgi:uncharacterized membrane protein
MPALPGLRAALNYGGCRPILQTRKGAAQASQNNNFGEGDPHMNPLNNHKHSLLLGIVLAVVIALVLAASLGGGIAFHQQSFARWLHIVSGVFWIGLLYYFNAVQVPALAEATGDKGGPGGAGITKYVAPRALFWFRWSALLTWFAGAWLLGPKFVPAFTFGAFHNATGDLSLVTIGIGVWLGTIMLLNVWGPIWQNQKKILGIKPATDEEKAKARKVALYASRTNFVLSIPMLMCMAGTSHQLPF